MNPLYAIGAAAIALAVLAGMWQWDRAAQFEAGRQAMADQIKAAADEAQRQKDRDSAERLLGATKAEFTNAERMRALEAEDAKRQADSARRAADLDRVRADLRASRAARPPDPAAAGCTDSVRAGKLRDLLDEGFGLLDEGVGLASEGADLGNEGARDAAAGQSLIQLCRDFDRAIRIGAAASSP